MGAIAPSGVDAMVEYVIPLDPDHDAERQFLPGAHRKMGIHVMAGKGAGKSRLLGRIIGFSDLFCGIPQVIFDPLGTTIDQLLDKVARLPRDLQLHIWPRVKYVDMSGQGGRTMPFPLFYDLGGESHRDRAERFLQVVLRMDPNLASASVQGWRAISRVGRPTGIVLSALGYQITEAADLLRNPEAWEARLDWVRDHVPEAATAVDFFLREYLPADARERREISRMYLSKVQDITIDPTMVAMFGANTPGIHLPDVVAGGQTVLLDFRHETNRERRRFKTMWAFDYLLSYVKHRGPNHPVPFSILIDELTEITNQKSLDHDVAGQELEELLNMYARNYNCWLTLAHQEMYQLSDRLNYALLGMGTQILGVTADLITAKKLAEYFFPPHPYREKYREPVYGSLGDDRGSTQIDERIHYMHKDEQVSLGAQLLTSFKPFQYLVRPCSAEGDISQPVFEIDLSYFDRGQWPSDNREEVLDARQTLAGLLGESTNELLSAIQQRLSDKVPAANPAAPIDGHDGNLPTQPLLPSDTIDPVPSPYDTHAEPHPSLDEVFRERCDKL